MAFDLTQSVQILTRTPRTLRELLTGIDIGWLQSNEGPETWCAIDIVGHLVHGEETDWIPRVRCILEHGETKPFQPFDRFAQLRAPKRSMHTLLDQFLDTRQRNLDTLASFQIQPEQLALRGTHPSLGQVTLGQLIATWAAHDLGHLAQISRVMAKRYTEEVGPWEKYLSVLHDRVPAA